MDNLKCFNCGSESVWAGENRYLCSSGCSALGPHRGLFLAVVEECRKRFKREETT